MVWKHGIQQTTDLVKNHEANSMVWKLRIQTQLINQQIQKIKNKKTITNATHHES